MPSLTESRLLRYFAFAALYFAQGVPFGFVTTGLVVLLADLKLDNAAVGAAIGLSYLPWSFKILWGPLLDAVPNWRFGRRRPFLLFAEAVMGITLIAMVGVDPKADLPTLSLLIFLHNTFAAMQDVATDALAVDVLKEDERGTANSIMWAAKSLGVAFGGGGGTVIAKHFGWTALFGGMAGIMWAVLLIPLLVRERPRRDDDVTTLDGATVARLAKLLIPFLPIGVVMYGMSVLADRLGESPYATLVSVLQPMVAVVGAVVGMRIADPSGFTALRGSFSVRAPRLGLIAALIAPIGYALVASPSSRMLRADLKFSEEQIATLSGIVDPLSGVAGALIGGWLADRFGTRGTSAAMMVCIAATLAGFAGVPWAWPSFWFIVAFTIANAMAVNAFSAANLGLSMQLSNPLTGATQFAVFMAMTNLTYAWTAPAGGWIADHGGYQVVFLVAAVIQLASIAILAPLDPEQARAHYRAIGALPAVDGPAG